MKCASWPMSALAASLRLAVLLGHYKAANDNGVPIGRDPSFLYIGYPSRREGP